jgi:hypothetical protein
MSPEAEAAETRQKRIQEMLKEFSKKKDKVIRDQIKNRGAAGQLQPPQLHSTKHSNSRQQILLVEDHIHSHRHGGPKGKDTSNTSMVFTVEDEN